MVPHPQKHNQKNGLRVTGGCSEAIVRFADCVDYGDAPTISVSGPASVCLVDDDVQITYFSRVSMPDGTIENRVACRLRLSWRKWLATQMNFEEARAAILREVQNFIVRSDMN